MTLISSMLKAKLLALAQPLSEIKDAFSLENAELFQFFW